MVEKVLRLEADFDGKKAEAGLEDMEKMCDETKAKIESLTTELGFKIKPVTILKESDLKKAEKRLEEIRKEIEHITSETDKLLSQAVTDGQAQNILAMEAEELKKLTAEQEVLNEAVAKYKTERATIAAEKQRGQDIKSVNSDVSESGKADEFVSKIKTAEQYRLELDRVQSRMSEIEAETARLAAQKGINPNDALAANKEYQRLNKRLEALASTTRKFKRTSSGAFGDAKKQAQSMGESMKKAIKTMSKYTLAVFGARSAFFAVKNAIRQVLSDNEELNNTVTAIKGVFSNALAPYVERLVSIIQYGLAFTFEFWTNKLSPIAQGVRNVTEMLLSYLKRFWDSIKNFWNSKIKPIFTFEFWTNKLSPIAQGVRNVTDTLLSNLKKFWNSVTSYWNAKIKPKFTIEFWTNKLSPIAQGGRNAINTLLSYIERGLNWIVKRVNAISFSVPEWVPGIGGSRVGFNLAPVSLPRLAKGAIVNNPGRGVDINAGEAGREAILPLDNYTEWMDELADKIAARISFPIINKFIVGDKEICSIYKKYQAKFNLETNGGVL